MALAQLYVDPAINGDSGTGTIGDPYGDLEYCLSQATLAAAGTQINIKAGTTEALAAGLSVAAFGTPTAAKPLVLRGYTSAANDGGFGVVSGGGTINNLFATALSHVSLIDMHITNYAQTIISGSSNWCVSHCEIDTAGQYYSAASFSGSANAVIGCYIHDCRDGYGVSCSAGGSGALVASNVFANGTYDFNQIIRLLGGSSVVRNNVFVLDGASIGVYASYAHNHVIGNSMRSSSGTGVGIKYDGDCGGMCSNNIVTGFSGSGGKAILSTSTDNLQVLGPNAYYNNATNNGYAGSLRNDLTALDVALASDPFVNATGGDYAINGTIAGVTEAAWPSAYYGVASTTSKADLGAVQAGAGAAPDYPAEADVRLGVDYNSAANTGTLDLPAVADVQAGVTFDGATKTGTFVAPAVGDVEAGVEYGAAAEYTGTFAVPAEADVKSGITYGDSAEFEGTLASGGGAVSISPARGGGIG